MEQPQWMPVCALCGSDSIVDSKYGTTNGWCDYCEDFKDSKRINVQDYNPLRSDIGEWVESLDGKRNEVKSDDFAKNLKKRIDYETATIGEEADPNQDDDFEDGIGILEVRQSYIDGLKFALKLFNEEEKDQMKTQQGRDMADGLYAVVRWQLEDVHQHRENMEWSKWTDEQASERIIGNEGRIQDRMVEIGWDVIDTLMVEGAN